MVAPGPPPPPPPGGYGPPGGSGYGPPAGGFGALPGGFGPPPGAFGPAGGPPGMMVAGPRFHPLAIASMILGIVAIPSCCCWFFGSPMAGAGLLLGILALGKIRGAPQQFKGAGMAIAGIACSSFALLLDLLAIFTTMDDYVRNQVGGGRF